MIRDTDEVTTLLDPITTLPPEFRPLRVEEYHRLIDTGVFDGTHVELVSYTHLTLPTIYSV